MNQLKHEGFSARNGMKSISRWFLIVLLGAALALSAILVVKQPANAKPSLSPDGVKCTPCHTDGRSGKKSTPAKTTTTKPKATKKTSAKPATEHDGHVSTKAAAKVKTDDAHSVQLTVESPGKEAIKIDCMEHDGEVLVPVRKLAESMHAKVAEWNNKQKTATVVTHFGKRVKVAAAKMVNGSAYASADDLATKLGASYDAKTHHMKKDKSTLVAEQFAMGNPHDKSSWGTITTDTPANREPCMMCHDGQGFAYDKSKRAELPASAKSQVNSIDCQACHSKRGKEIMNSGSTPKLANGYQVKSAGKGALCITCHNGRKTPTASPKSDSNPAPHGSFQADMLYGFGGYNFGLAMPTSPHGANPDTCVGCHMAPGHGIKSHSFKVENAEAACGKCHPGLTTVNRPALSDYDGDKIIEGVQDEVKGLISLVEHALEEAVPTGHMHQSHGQVYFEDKTDKTKKVNASPEAYWAAWNLIAVENDGSHGVHNPAYMISLLQKTYKQLTGKNVPNATLR